MVTPPFCLDPFAIKSDKPTDEGWAVAEGIGTRTVHVHAANHPSRAWTHWWRFALTYLGNGLEECEPWKKQLLFLAHIHSYVLHKEIASKTPRLVDMVKAY